jgi:hypothetical protein
VLNDRDLKLLEEIEGDLARDPRLVRALSMERFGARWRLACDLTVGFSLALGVLCLVLADNGTGGSAVVAALLAAAIVVVRHRRFPYRLRSKTWRRQKRAAMP